MIENSPEPKAKSVYNLFLTISLIVNVVLASFSGYSAFKTSTLEDEKRKMELEKGKIEQSRLNIEQELLIEKNTPHLSTFYLITKIESLHAFLESKQPFPYAQQVERYRILENEKFQQLSSEMKNFRENKNITATIHFLVIVNSGEINAYNTQLLTFNGDSVRTGTIELHSALLIPIYYNKINSLRTEITPLFKSLAYDSKVGDLEHHFSENIKDPVSPSWVPTLGDLRGWGRATTKNDDSYLKDLLPKK